MVDGGALSVLDISDPELIAYPDLPPPTLTVKKYRSSQLNTYQYPPLQVLHSHYVLWRQNHRIKVVSEK